MLMFNNCYSLKLEYNNLKMRKILFCKKCFIEIMFAKKDLGGYKFILYPIFAWKNRV